MCLKLLDTKNDYSDNNINYFIDNYSQKIGQLTDISDTADKTPHASFSYKRLWYIFKMLDDEKYISDTSNIEHNAAEYFDDDGDTKTNKIGYLRKLFREKFNKYFN